jgi:hypothetical protein
VTGTTNGEVILWDLTSPELPTAVSPISAYSHSGPLLKLHWLRYGGRVVLDSISSSTSDGDWVIASVGVDGKVKVLF